MLGIVGEMTGVVAVQIGARRRYDGPLGKSDRAFLLGLVGLLLGLGLDIHLFVNMALAGAVMLLMVTIRNRAQSALREVT